MSFIGGETRVSLTAITYEHQVEATIEDLLQVDQKGETLNGENNPHVSNRQSPGYAGDEVFSSLRDSAGAKGLVARLATTRLLS